MHGEVEVIVEYTVIEGMEGEADTVRQAFLDAVKAWEPDRLTYRVLRRGPQGNAWIHLAWLDSPDTQERLFETEFFKEFDAGMERISGGTVAATPLFAWTPA